MQIAIIAWGSLIHDPRELALDTGFKLVGPTLPLEFSRISRDGRLTLVIDERNGVERPTFSALSSFGDLDRAIHNLRVREGKPSKAHIGYINLRRGKQRLACQSEAIGRRLRDWADAAGVDAVIWTGLPSNFAERTTPRVQFSVEAGLRYLQSLSPQKLQLALDYFHRAPVEVQTPLRAAVEGVWPRPTAASPPSGGAGASFAASGPPKRTEFNLSKSKIASFEQCRKRLWLEVHTNGLQRVSASRQSVMGTGNVVGDIAQQSYPDGVLIGHPTQPFRAVEQTSELLQAGHRRPMFEAAFLHQNVVIRADLMLPAEGGDGWHMAEVKSTASAKPHHFRDLATQVWVTRGAGLDVTQATVRHIDREFVYATEGDYSAMFIDAESPDLDALIAERPTVADKARRTLEGPEPDIRTGEHCAYPHLCPFLAHCRSGEPARPKYPVQILWGPAGKALARKLVAEGYRDLTAVPLDYELPPLQKRIHHATVTGEVYCDTDALREGLAGWGWPMYFLDFETINFSIPRWIGTRPFEIIPFQFSLYHQRPDGAHRNAAFLDLSGENPSRACAEALVQALGDTEGRIVAYGAKAEIGVVNRLAAQFPEFSAALSAISERIVDLRDLIFAHYYHRDMEGSFSLKDVAPTVAPDLSYGLLDDVRHGLEAQQAFSEAISPDVSVDRKQHLEQAMLRYCRQDTWALLRMVNIFMGRPTPV
jgi:Domain of unknown function(DUF2779)